METAEILHQFERATGKFARAAVEAAVARREEVTPHLLRILEETVDRAAQLDDWGDYMAHLYVMFLLAQFRETRAYPLVVRFASLPGDLLDSLCGDFITEDLGQVLASVCGGDIAGIQSVIENEDADEWARGAALSSLVTLVAVGQRSRDEIVIYFARLFRGKLAREWSHLWDSLICDSSDLAAANKPAGIVSGACEMEYWLRPVCSFVSFSWVFAHLSVPGGQAKANPTNHWFVKVSALVRSPSGGPPLAFTLSSRERMPASTGSWNRFVIKRRIDVVSYAVWSTKPFLAKGDTMIAGMRMPGPQRSPFGGAT